ncbi:hypothetical protein EJ04DRAFT_152613 [Polyplosphaeria fusca]|uniref:Uncharacterized protein n=1 Tax=Polyplosphaeria fusca TaxID=682080 RepID=A0A9P4QLF2_9PLEO|nr:hypothetical protein EJ04DRAFT_152613 [Polyplosphaeria fusca]
MDPFTPSPTPPIPPRAPHHHSFSKPLPPLLDMECTTELLPLPLFSKRKRRPPNTVSASTTEMPITPSSTAPSSPTSTRSSRSGSVSTPPTSAPSSPRTQASSLSYSPGPPTPSCWATIRWNPTPEHTLKRKLSPKNETLRSLRAKESDACLQRLYERQTDAYLNGMVLGSTKARSRLRMVSEDCTYAWTRPSHGNDEFR